LLMETKCAFEFGGDGHSAFAATENGKV